MGIHVLPTLKQGNKRIEGDETKTKYAKQVQASRFSFDVVHTRNGVPGTRKFHDAMPAVSTTFAIDKLPDSASPDLFAACAKGMIFATVKLTVTKVVDDNPVETEIYTLHDAVLASMTTSSHGDLGDRTETLQFSFAKVEIEHKKLDGVPVRTVLDFRQEG